MRHTNQAGAKVTVQQETTEGIVLTEGAAAKVSGLLAQEGRDDLRLRIAVQPGGCSGLRYQLYFDEREIDGDIVADFGGVQVVTAFVPLSEMFGYTTDLRSATQGRATSTMHFERYDQAPKHVAEEVIAKVQGVAK